MHNDTVFVQKVLVFAQYKWVLHSFYPRFYRRTLIICNYCCCLFNFPTQNHKKGQIPRGGTPTVVAQSSAQARHSLARGHKIAKKAQFPRGGTPTVVAQFKHVVSLGLPIRSNGLQQLLVYVVTGSSSYWVTRFSLLDIFFSLVECPPFLYLLLLTIILVL